MMADKQTLGQRWEDYRPSKTTWFWSCVVCLILPIVVGFTWGGWVTQTAAARMRDAAGQEARAAVAAAYCVSKFDSAPDAATQLASLKKTESWQRSEFIDKGGWTKMPGQDKSVDGAADLCAQQLVASAPAKPNST
jgi:hypothetical protein